MKSNLSPLHQTDSEKLQNSTEGLIGETAKNGTRLDELNNNVKGLHQTAQDQSGADSRATAVVNGVESLKSHIDNPEGVVRKLDEVKSAGLITNKLLKDMSQKPQKMELVSDSNQLASALFSILRGPQGEKGKDSSVQGPPGKDGKDGKDGKEGKSITGPKGLAGKDSVIPGPPGKDGKSVTGPPGKDGKDGSPDEPDEVVNKVHSSKLLIKAHKVEGLPGILRTVEDLGKNQQGWQNTGGAQPLVWRSNGVVISQFVTEINISTNITPTYDGNGRITLTATGGGGTTYSETPSGSINSSNVTFTTAHSITTVINFAINGQYVHPAEYSVSGTTITFVTAPNSSLSGTGFTITYQ